MRAVRLDRPRASGCRDTRSKGCGLLAVGSVQSWGATAGQSAHERQLPAVMDGVRDDPVPQKASYRPRATKERKRTIKICGRQLADPGRRLPVNAIVSGREVIDRARPRDVRRFRVQSELAPLDAVTD